MIKWIIFFIFVLIVIYVVARILTKDKVQYNDNHFAGSRLGRIFSKTCWKPC